METRSVTREVPKLELRADVVPSTFDAEKRTVQVTWTTGARVKRGFWEPYYEELSLDPKHVRMDRIASGNAPLLNTHRSYDLTDVIGVVDNAKLEGKRGTGTIRFARTTDGETAMQMVADGILRNLSVGYRVHKLVKIEDGQDKVPVYRAEDWEPYELSMVPIGADAGAVTRSGDGMTNPCEFIEERAMPEPEIKTETTTTTTGAGTATAPQITAEQRAEIARIERDRTEGIRRIGSKLGRPEAEIIDAISKGATLEAFRAAAVDALANAPADEGGVVGFDKRDARVQPGADAREKWLRGATAWLIQRAGHTGLIAGHAKKTGKTADLDAGEFRGMKLLDLARQSLEFAGVRTAGMSQMEIAGRALSMRGIGGAGSTSDFPVLLENVLNKTMLAQYDLTPNTWNRFCKTGSVTDFRASNRYRRGSFGPLDKLNELGEFQRKAIPDGEKQSITAGTKGNTIAISRQTIVNDDMNAFDSLATDFGSAAAWSIELDVYALLAQNSGAGPTMSDGVALFHANHSNITTQLALGSDAIDKDRIAMASQKDVSKNRILALTPAILLVPMTLEGTAKQINNGQYDFDALSTKNPWTPNKVAGVFKDIIGTAQLTGTRRYLFADPALAPVIEVVFLDGQQQPYMEMRMGFDVDGIEWKVRLDYGVGAIDWRPAITNAG